HVNAALLEPRHDVDSASNELSEDRVHLGFVARDRARGEDDAIPGHQLEARMLIAREASERSALLALRAGRDREELGARPLSRELLRQDELVGPREITGRARDARMRSDAASEQHDLATGAPRDLAEEAQAMDVRGEHRDDDGSFRLEDEALEDVADVRL